MPRGPGIFKRLGDDSVRITVRLPKDLHDAIWQARRGLPQRDTGFLSRLVRDALQHYLDCETLQPARKAKQAEQERLRAIPLQPLPGERAWTQRLNALYPPRSPSPTEE
jgi:Arc/MetJ-type ribon-helix-helix transcriptional regulator